MRYVCPFVLLLSLAACAPPIPNSGANSGVGFDEYGVYDQRSADREAALIGSIADPSARAISDEQLEPAIATNVPTQAKPIKQDNPGISDEQDFSAVSARETIESDRQRVEAQSQAFKIIEPTALPTRSGSTGPSIVEFALSTSNAPGQSVYNRSGAFAESRFNKNCAKYGSSDLAQMDFLKSGGPQRDRKGLDPDGDGFACYWDPTPFRQATR